MKIPKKLIEKLADKEWRINNLYKITNKRAERETFKQNPIQSRIFKTANSRKLILKARQFGVSTNEIIDIFDDTIWKENQTNVILSHEQDSVKKLFRIVQRAYNYLPEELKPRLDRGGGSKYEMFFPARNSRIYCDLESRSDTITRLHISEGAFFKNPEKLISTLQAVPLWCPVTIESTPNGVGNFYYEWWQDSDSPYAKLFFPWYIFPEYAVETNIKPSDYSHDEKEFVKKAKKYYGVDIKPTQVAFRRLKKAENKHLFIQEYPEDDQSCFLSSSNSAFDLLIVAELMLDCPKPLKDEGALKIYKEREPGKTYVVAGDPAEGGGKDNSVGVVFEAESCEQVAVFCSNKLKPSDFAHELADLAGMYPNRGNQLPLLMVERNNHGHAVLQELDEQIKYPNLFSDKDDKLGWHTDRVSRPLMIDVFIEGVENKQVKINDKPTLQECLTLVDNDGKIEAGQSKKDDRVIASAIAVQGCKREAVGAFFDDFKNKIRV